MIGIIDYHLNNLRSVQKAFEKAGAASFISDRPDELRAAEKLVLPGVGAFGTAMDNLDKLGMIELLHNHAASHRPILGICLGMQLLFTKSFELGEYSGLQFISGEARMFPATVKVPHMGWNQIEINKQSPIVRDVDDKSFVYFVHSYCVVTDADTAVAETEYGIRFASIVQRGMIFGIQFHPEKSQRTGIQLLKNFADL
jgi:glutamine amidotransferase